MTPLSLDPFKISPWRSIKWRRKERGKIKEEDVMRKLLPISSKEYRRILDLLIDPLCPLSLNKMRGIEVNKGMNLRLMRLSVCILKSKKHSLEHSRRS